MLNYEENISGCEPVIIDGRASFDPLNPANDISYYINYSFINTPIISEDLAGNCSDLDYEDSGLFCFEPTDGENKYLFGFNIKLPDGRTTLTQEVKIFINDLQINNKQIIQSSTF